MRCPGQDTRYWKADAIFEVKCPGCGQSTEFFKDESSRRCKQCGHKVINPRLDFGCAAYCKYAAQCLADPDMLVQREDLLKNRVALEMKKYFQKDFKRIGHAAAVARYAESLVKAEKGDPAVVISAAYLHDIGIKEAERKYQSAEAVYQEKEGPPVAREILIRLGADDKLIEEVCDIIGHHHHPRAEETINFKILYEADLIVNLEEQHKAKPIEAEKMSGLIDQVFLTESGRTLARTVLLGSSPKTSEEQGEL